MSKSESTTFSARNMELLCAAIQCVKGGEIAIDYEKFAVKAGLKNAASARTAWSQLKKVIDKAKDTTGADESVAKSIETPEASPAKGKKRKGAAASAGEMDGDDEEALSVSPAKTPFKRGGKTPKQEPAVKGDDEEDTMKEEASDS